VGGLLLLALLLIILAIGVFSTAGGKVGLVAVIPPGGKGDRAEVLDREGHQKGYGIRRSDGSWDYFHMDGSSLDVISRRELTEKGLDGELTRIVLQPRRGK
jgi:hypothetical protein